MLTLAWHSAFLCPSSPHFPHVIVFARQYFSGCPNIWHLRQHVTPMWSRTSTASHPTHMLDRSMSWRRRSAEHSHTHALLFLLVRWNRGRRFFFKSSTAAQFQNTVRDKNKISQEINKTYNFLAALNGIF